MHKTLFLLGVELTVLSVIPASNHTTTADNDIKLPLDAVKKHEQFLCTWTAHS